MNADGIHRLLIMAALLPLLVSFVGAGGTSSVGTGEELSWGALALLSFVGILIALLFARIRLPAPFLLGGMLVSAVAHFFGWVHGLPPFLIMLFGFVIVGAVGGARFSDLALRDLIKNLGSAIASVGMTALISAIFAVVMSSISELPLAQVWVAYAPGGVEAMAAIGLAFGFDPAFVALHHLFRISLLILMLPILVKRALSSAQIKPRK